MTYFPISNDQLNENEVIESEPISPDISTSPPSNITVHETSSNCQPLFRCNDYVKNEVFDTFYEDYLEFNPYSPNVTFPYSLKTSENRRFSDVFTGVQKCNIGRIWVRHFVNDITKSVTPN